MTALEDRTVAEQGCPRCGAQPAQPCTRAGTALKHPHADRAGALGARLGAEAQQRASAPAGALAGAPAGAATFTECATCGNQFGHPQAASTCGSATACNRRKAAHTAEAELGLELTVFKSPGLIGQVKAAEARIAEARPEPEDAEDAGDGDEDGEDAGAA